MADDGARLQTGVWIPDWQVSHAARVVRVAVEKLRADNAPLTRGAAQFIDAMLTAAAKLGGRPVDAATVALDRADVIGSLIDVDQAAARLRLSPERVRQLAKAGRLGGRQVGQTWVFDPLEIDAYTAERESAA